MVKKMKKEVKDLSTVKAIYKNLRSSPRKLNDILKSIRGKKADVALRNLQFSEKEFQKKYLKQLNLQYQMQRIIINWILII